MYSNLRSYIVANEHQRCTLGDPVLGMDGSEKNNVTVMNLFEWVPIYHKYMYEIYEKQKSQLVLHGHAEYELFQLMKELPTHIIPYSIR